jgi:hypothetical protein
VIDVSKRKSNETIGGELGKLFGAPVAMAGESMRYKASVLRNLFGDTNELNYDIVESEAFDAYGSKRINEIDTTDIPQNPNNQTTQGGDNNMTDDTDGQYDEVPREFLQSGAGIIGSNDEFDGDDYDAAVIGMAAAYFEAEIGEDPDYNPEEVIDYAVQAGVFGDLVDATIDLKRDQLDTDELPEDLGDEVEAGFELVERIEGRLYRMTIEAHQQAEIKEDYRQGLEYIADQVEGVDLDSAEEALTASEEASQRTIESIEQDRESMESIRNALDSDESDDADE